MLKLNLHQQFGRAGRRKNANGSLAIFVPGKNPIDQYYLENPHELLGTITKISVYWGLEIWNVVK